jgi:hypothetical protein
MYVPASHETHVRGVQLAVKPPPVVSASDLNRKRRYGVVAVYVASAGVLLSIASCTTPDENVASSDSSTYT